LPLQNLASLYSRRRLYREAEPHYLGALAILEKTVGEDHPHVATTLRNYADALRKMGRKREATSVERRANAILGRRGEESPGLVDYHSLLPQK